MNAFVLALAATVVSATPQKHPFTAEDLNAFDRLEGPQVSPDGRLVAFEVRSTDWEANKGVRDVYVAEVETGVVRQLTRAPANDSAPRWTPDGRSVLFLSTRGGSSQVWQLPIDGGEAKQVTRFPLDVDAFEIFPDGQRLLLAMEVYPALPAGKALDATAKRFEEESKSTVQVADALMYRHWDTWEDHKRDHLFVWKQGDVAPVDLMAGMDADCPTKPFGSNEDFSISPDGSEVAFAAKLAQRDEAWTTNVDIWTVPSSGKAKPKAVTAENKAFDGQPAYSPDGKWLAYAAMQREGYESDRQRIVLIDRANGTKRVLTEAWDRSVAEIVWSKDSKTIWSPADHLGHHALFAIDAASGEAKPVVEKGTNISVHEAGERLVYSHDSLTMPAELFTVPKAGGEPKQLTHLNDARLAQIDLGVPEQFTFAGAKGEEVHAFVMKPAGFKANRRYPVALIVHGGPESSMGDHFHYRWNPQAYAGSGRGVVFIDFHGSTGYGQAFTDAMKEHWGEAPYEDVIKGLDAALQKYPWLDGSRACALGASYGGYMMNWIAGHTDRFKCLVTHDGIFDTTAAFYETEELWFPEWEFAGPAWEKNAAALYEQWNPRNFVANWKTPMLVIHGGLDYRLPDTQGMMAFTALQRRGVPSRFVHLADENHWVLKPKNSLRWHAEVLKWLEQWTGR